MTTGGGKTPILKRKPPMRRVLIAAFPCIAGSVYYFGWRSLAVTLVSCLAAFLAEYAFCKRRNEPVGEDVFVTAVLFALVMPPTVPWHVVIIGVVFAIVFSKQAFGGFGCNTFNPALSGRCFVYVCFPVALTSTWAPAAQGSLGALAQWSTVSGPDAISSATAMTLMKAGEYVPSGSDLFYKLLLGRLSGTMGVTSALLILLGGVYLFGTKTANRTLIVTVIGVYALLNQLLHSFGVGNIPGAVPALLGGGFLFGAFFMVTDPVTAPRTSIGRVIYAALIAVCTFVIRNYSIFNGGMMFSILLGNMFAPIIDHAVKSYSKTNKAVTP